MKRDTIVYWLTVFILKIATPQYRRDAKATMPGGTKRYAVNVFYHPKDIAPIWRNRVT